ncbi:MAG: hypothetical protein AAGA26_00225 [Pseudomonadota bacterium]
MEATRFLAIPARDLASIGPSISVYTLGEDAETENNGPRSYKCDLLLMIEINSADKAASPAEDVIDDIAEQVQCLLDQSPEMQGMGETSPLARETFYTGFELAFETDGKINIFGGRLSFSVTYFRDTPVKTEPPDHAGGDIDWDLRGPIDERGDIGPDGPIDARDTITVPEE